MKRYFATFFRGKWLYLAALLLMLGASALGTYYLSRSQYEATARIWVDKSALGQVLDQNTQPVYGYTPPPAQQQADKLFQLVQTDSFMTAILKGTTASAQLTGVPDDDRKVLDKVRKKLAISVLGANTVKISFTGPDPVLCQQVVQGTIDQFRTWSLESQVEQHSIELQFYQRQLKNYDEQVNDISRQINEFYQKYPNPDPSSPQYLELQRLQRELEDARGRYTITKTKIDQQDWVQTQAGQSGQMDLQVLDKPTQPRHPAATLGKLAKYLGLGIAASFGLVLAACVLATWLDPTIRTGEDLKRLSDVPVLQVIPRLKPGRARGKRGDPARDAPPKARGSLPATPLESNTGDD
jgi:uncharacterized protein involved in exopolysaccharide biosynthesis